MDYINRLDNYDGPDIALVALSDEYCMYEEAFAIYKKFDMNTEAIDVLLSKINSVPRAQEFAERTNIPEVWSRLASTYTYSGMTVEAIECFIKANDSTMYM